MKISINKNFTTRDELDSFVRSTFGDNADVNKDIAMEMSDTEMQSLALDTTTTVHGVKIISAEPV